MSFLCEALWDKVVKVQSRDTSGAVAITIELCGGPARGDPVDSYVISKEDAKMIGRCGKEPVAVSKEGPTFPEYMPIVLVEGVRGFPYVTITTEGADGTRVLHHITTGDARRIGEAALVNGEQISKPPPKRNFCPDCAAPRNFCPECGERLR